MVSDTGTISLLHNSVEPESGGLSLLLLCTFLFFVFFIIFKDSVSPIDTTPEEVFAKIFSQHI